MIRKPETPEEKWKAVVAFAEAGDDDDLDLSEPSDAETAAYFKEAGVDAEAVGQRGVDAVAQALRELEAADEASRVAEAVPPASEAMPDDGRGRVDGVKGPGRGK